ncbi:MAG: Bug family tripartite tricarboxylate transporter substrate binding protein [Burkholderiales bacterium]
MISLRGFLSVLLPCLVWSAGSSHAAYPEKSLKVILPYAAGGSGDIIFRSIQPGIEKGLGQSVVIDFRTGANGLIGVREAVKSPADGHTLLFGPTNNFVIDQFLNTKLGYDPLQVLAPITIVADTPYLLVINAATPAQSYGELAAFARANRGKLNYASPGAATVPHLSGRMLSDAMGADMTHVPFRGNQPAVVALLGNEVQMIVHSYGSIAPLFKAGKLRALAVAAPERLRVMPNVPTTAQAGIPEGVLLSNWWALAAPAGTPSDIVTRLAREVRATLADEALQKRYFEQGWTIGGNSPHEAMGRMRREALAWKVIVERSGATAE